MVVATTAAAQQLPRDLNMETEMMGQDVAIAQKRAEHLYADAQYTQNKSRNSSGKKSLLNVAKAATPFGITEIHNDPVSKKRKVQGGIISNRDKSTIRARTGDFGSTSIGNNVNLTAPQATPVLEVGMRQRYRDLPTRSAHSKNSALLAMPPPPDTTFPALFNFNPDTIVSLVYPVATFPAISQPRYNATGSYFPQLSLSIASDNPNRETPLAPEAIPAPTRHDVTKSQSRRNSTHLPKMAGIFSTLDMSGEKTPKTKPKITKSLFLAQVPSNKREWDELRTTSGFNEPETISDAFQTLVIFGKYSELPRSHQSPSPEEQVTRPPVCSMLLKEYQGLRQTLDARKSKNDAISRFRDLLFYCICLVSVQEGLDNDAVEMAVGAHSPSGKCTPNYWPRLRTATKRMACLIEDVEDAVGYQASQLFLMSDLSMEKYRSISESADPKNDFAVKLGNRLKSIGRESPDYDMSLSPLFLLAHMGAKLEHINKAFGTNLTPHKISLKGRKSGLEKGLERGIECQGDGRVHCEPNHTVALPTKGASQMLKETGRQPSTDSLRKSPHGVGGVTSSNTTQTGDNSNSQEFCQTLEESNSGRNCPAVSAQLNISSPAKQSILSVNCAVENTRESVLGQAAVLQTDYHIGSSMSPKTRSEIAACNSENLTPSHAGAANMAYNESISDYTVGCDTDSRSYPLPHNTSSGINETNSASELTLQHDSTDSQRTKGQNSPWFSSQVFIRAPVYIQYDHPILLRVQEGDVDGVRDLWQHQNGHVDVMDPYGLGLLYMTRIASLCTQ